MPDNTGEMRAARVPMRIASSVMSVGAEAGRIELVVTVSALNGVRTYAFSFAGAPVPIGVDGKGRFFAAPGREDLLEWVMVGEPGGTMKVVVTRGDEVVRERAASTITPPYGEGYDFFRIQVS